jgi:hypothetical protein
MKKLFLPTLLPLLSVIALTPLNAQMEGNATAPMNEGNQSPPPPPTKEERHGPMSQLSDAERSQLKAAHDKAIEQDPTLQEKMKEAYDTMEAARQGMNDAMVKFDPGVEAILAKIVPPKREWKKEGWPNQGGKTLRPWKYDSPGGKGMANLSVAERQRVKVLHEQVKNNPAIVAARDAMKQATTPDARKEAARNLYQARRGAMVKADPSIEPILEKLRPQAAEQPNTTPAD